MNDDRGGPEQPASGGTAGPASVDRRTFLDAVSLGALGVAALLVAVPFVGFLVAPLFVAPPRLWRVVGRVDTFKTGDIVEVTLEETSALPWAGSTERTAAWLWRESAETFVAYSVNCSHLGCPVRWEADAKLFLCPCHGGVYYQNGEVAAGPPPRGLTRYPVRINEGNVEVLTSPAPIT